MVNPEYASVVTEILSNKNKRKFNESVDIAINLKQVDMSQPQNRIDTEIILPHGIGRDIRVGVFARGDMAERAKNSGCFMVISPDEIDKLGDDRAKLVELVENVDFFVSDAQLMPTIGKRLGSVLGRKGKMPQPIPPNADIKSIVERLSKSIRLRSRDKATFHARIGSETMSPEHLAENIETVVSNLLNILEKGRFNISSIYIKTTMSKAGRINI
jgi:large subunit ribosomal protein L1